VKIYTGTCGGEKLEKVKEFDMGIMVYPSRTRRPCENLGKVSCALDNGAFRCWQRGYPFMEEFFWQTIRDCYDKKIDLDFIVCPDIVTGGKRSLDFSIEYANSKLRTSQNLALAVQDGVKPSDIDKFCLSNFSHIFIGGSVEWKWETAEQWVDYAHGKEMKCHIGRCGTLDRLRYARGIGADSVDSTSIARNDSWRIIEALNDNKTLFA
jgi:hypothetical protein